MVIVGNSDVHISYQNPVFDTSYVSMNLDGVTELVKFRYSRLEDKSRELNITKSIIEIGIHNALRSIK